MVPPYIHYDIYGIRWSNRWPFECACQAVSQGDAEDLGRNQHLPVRDYNIHHSLSEGMWLVWLHDNTKIHFRRFNALLTRGVMLSDPPASPSFWHFLMPKKIYEIQIKNVSNLQSFTLKIFTFCTKIPNTTTTRYGSERSVSNNNLTLLRNGRGSFAVPLSSRHSLPTSRLSKVLWRFPTFMTNPLPRRLVG